MTLIDDFKWCQYNNSHIENSDGTFRFAHCLPLYSQNNKSTESKKAFKNVSSSTICKTIFLIWKSVYAIFQKCFLSSLLPNLIFSNSTFTLCSIASLSSLVWTPVLPTYIFICSPYDVYFKRLSYSELLNIKTPMFISLLAKRLFVFAPYIDWSQSHRGRVEGLLESRLHVY